MNWKPALPLTATAAAAFAAGLLVSPALHRDTAAKTSGTAASTQNSDSDAHLTGASNHAPLGTSYDHRPRETQDLVAAFKDAVTEPNIYRRVGKIWWLSEAITPQNAKAVVESAMQNGNGPEREFMAVALYGSWARVDVKGALAHANALRKGRERDQALSGVLSGWATVDFEAANRWVDALPNGDLKRSSMQAIISALAETDPDRALDLVSARAQTNDSASFMMSFAIFPEMVRRDPQHAAERAAGLPPGSMRNNAIRAVADNWSRTDRDATMAWLDSFPEGPTKQGTLSSVVGQWVVSDFDSAYAWLEKRPPGVARNRMLRATTFNAANNNPETALKLVDLMSSNSAQDEMLGDISRIWARTDSVAARSWAESQTDANVKKAVMRGIVNGMTPYDPQQAAALVQDLPKNEQADMTSDVARSWANQDPSGAAKWAAGLSDADIRTNALGNVMSQWVNEDPTAALKWFTDTQTGKDRDALVQRFSSSLVENDPNLAVQWVRTIQDEKKRLSQLENLARNWVRLDPAAASTWITSSELSADVKKRLISESSK